MKNLLSSLLLSTSLLTTACYGKTAPAKPVAAERQTKLDRTKVRATLAARRAVMIERFLAYREARVYPRNPEPGTKRHIWFDGMGNLCAAATLLSGDWGRDATMKVGEKDRGIALAKVTKGEVADWMLTSGLTHHEIVAIQVPPMGEMPIRIDTEVERLYGMYTDVERQLRTLGDENLELATDALMRRPDLARALLAGHVPGPGRYFVAPVDPGAPVAPPEPAPSPEPA